MLHIYAKLCLKKGYAEYRRPISVTYYAFHCGLTIALQHIETSTNKEWLTVGGKHKKQVVSNYWKILIDNGQTDTDA
uniref:Uncharacterized protein n=1 Tax=Romanomermis culicivorax TaxID=13658 RepID=A0A915JJ88_ROMCU